MNATRAGAAAGTLGLAITGAASLSAAAQAQNQGSTPFMRVVDRSLVAGQAARIRAKIGPEHAGRPVVLQYRRSDAAAWKSLRKGRVGDDGRVSLRAVVPRSGTLRVAVQPEAAAASASASSHGSHTNEADVKVARRVGVAKRRLHVKAGRRTLVKGRVKPGERGVPVRLQARRGGRWVTLDRDRTASRGRYVLRERIRSTMSSPARVVVQRKNGFTRGKRKVGRLNGYRYAHASWYGPGFYGNRTACGQTLRPGMLGVAHKTLPCGTTVAFRNRGRTVRVRVIDRGPYVAGREYDLTEATAQRLGFRGHGAVLSTR